MIILRGEKENVYDVSRRLGIMKRVTITFEYQSRHDPEFKNFEDCLEELLPALDYAADNWYFDCLHKPVVTDE